MCFAFVDGVGVEVGFNIFEGDKWDYEDLRYHHRLSEHGVPHPDVNYSKEYANKYCNGCHKFKKSPLHSHN